MKFTTAWAGVLTLLFSCFTVQFSQAVLQASQTMTNYGSIAPLNPKNDIFWEYGAESGLLQPPFSPIGVSPGGTYCAHSSDPSGTWITTQKVRTGRYALKDYIHPPPHDNPCRRLHNQWWGNTHDEFYFSVWVYFPSSSTWDQLDTSVSSPWVNVGGNVRTYFGPLDDEWRYSTGMAWVVNRKTNRIYVEWDFMQGYHNQRIELHGSGHYVHDFVDEWVQLQIYYKFHPTDGAFQAWLRYGGNEYDLGSRTGMTTDPRGYSDWDEKAGYFAPISSGHVYLQDSLYEEKGMKSVLKYMDDMVASTTKVPENYGVVED